MIRTSSVPNIYKILSFVFYYGLSKQFRYEYIEERISKSHFVHELENDFNESYLYEYSLIDILKDIYPRETFNEQEVLDYDVLSAWIAEAYTRLFYKFHKPFAYLFLYFPLCDMEHAFNIYHEMDWTQLYSYYLDRTKGKTILSSLLDKKDLTMNQLSVLTGINVNTILSYCRSDEKAFSASFSNIMKISKVLDINPNIFLEEIDNYTRSDSYSFDKTNVKYRHYLGLIISSYFNKDVNKNIYVYDETKNILKSKDCCVKAIWTDPTKDEYLRSHNKNGQIWDVAFKFSNEYEKDTNQIYLVIFEFNQESDNPEYYVSLNEFGFKTVFIINQSYFLEISERRILKRHIPDSLNESAIQQAKRLTGGDFAL